jgi:pimeloyl-ACP methyl ester carboxylesterase
MPITHCLPTGSLGTSEIPVIQVPGGGTVLTPSSGFKRGVVVLLHGLQLINYSAFPVPLIDNSVDLLLTFATDLATDGWVVLFPGLLGDNNAMSQNNAIFNDINADSGHGSRLLTNTLHWWDHVVDWVSVNYGNWPIVPFGISWGGWHALQIAINRTSTVIAYGTNTPVTQLWTLPFFSQYDKPPMVSYTLAPGMNGLNLPQSTITVNESIGGAASSGSLVVATTSGGQPQPQFIYYTGKSGSSFTGCTGGFGTDTMATNGSVTQSLFTNGLDISPSALNGINIPGYITWETGDQVVGYANTQILYNTAHAAGAPVSNNVISGGGHVLLTAEINAALDWFTNSVDFPLAPKQF